MRKKVLAGSIGVLVIAFVALALWWLFQSGHLVYVANTSAKTASLVCDSALVDRYNEAAYYEVRSDSTVPSANKEAIAKIAEEIKKRSGYETDPTCQTLLFWAAFHADDYTAAIKAQDALKNLYAKNQFANSNIRNNVPLLNYTNYTNMLTNPNGKIEG